MDASPLETVLKTPGAKLRVRATTHMVQDVYDLTVLEAEARAVLFTISWLPGDAFVGRFSEDCLEAGTALMGISQANPVGFPGDGDYLGVVEGRREFRFDDTSPPFLLSSNLASQLGDRRELELSFADGRFGGSCSLTHREDATASIVVDGETLTWPAVCYRETEGEPPASLTVLAGSRIVVGVTREGWSMNLFETRSPANGKP